VGEATYRHQRGCSTARLRPTSIIRVRRRALWEERHLPSLASGGIEHHRCTQRYSSATPLTRPARTTSSPIDPASSSRSAGSFHFTKENHHECKHHSPCGDPSWAPFSVLAVHIFALPKAVVVVSRSATYTKR